MAVLYALCEVLQRHCIKGIDAYTHAYKYCTFIHTYCTHTYVFTFHIMLYIFYVVPLHDICVKIHLLYLWWNRAILNLQRKRPVFLLQWDAYLRRQPFLTDGATTERCIFLRSSSADIKAEPFTSCHRIMGDLCGLFIQLLKSDWFMIWLVGWWAGWLAGSLNIHLWNWLLHCIT